MFRVESIPARVGKKTGKVLRPAKTIVCEDEHKVASFRRFLPKGETESGGFRKQDLVQFTSVQGGVRTIATRDIVDIS